MLQLVYKLLMDSYLSMVLPGRFELPFAASETAALSIELREPIKTKAYFVTRCIGSTRKETTSLK